MHNMNWWRRLKACSVTDILLFACYLYVATPGWVISTLIVVVLIVVNVEHFLDSRNLELIFYWRCYPRCGMVLRSVASVCVPVCLSVCNAVTFKSPDIESSFSHAGTSSYSYIKTIKSSWSRSQEPKSVKFHPAAPSVTDRWCSLSVTAATASPLLVTRVWRYLPAATHGCTLQTSHLQWADILCNDKTCSIERQSGLWSGTESVR